MSLINVIDADLGGVVPIKTRTMGGEEVSSHDVQLIAAGASVDIGAVADVAVSTDANGSVNAHLRGLVKITDERLPAALGQAAKVDSFPVTWASDQDPIGLAPGNAAIGGVKDNGIFYSATQTLGSSADATSSPLDITTAPVDALKAVMVDDLTFSAAVDMVVTIKEAGGANLLLFHYKTAQGVVQFKLRAWLRASVNKKIQLTASAAGQIYTFAAWHEQ